MINNKYKFREFLIAFCMPLYNIRYLNPFNIGTRLWVIHNFTDYYEVKAPILSAAKHCAIYWAIFIFDDQLPDTFEETEIAMHYFKL